MNKIAIATVFAILGTLSAKAAPAEYTLKLTPQQVDIIGAALGERPYREVVGIVGVISQQIQQQNSPPPSPSQDAPGTTSKLTPEGAQGR